MSAESSSKTIVATVKQKSNPVLWHMYRETLLLAQRLETALAIDKEAAKALDASIADVVERLSGYLTARKFNGGGMCVDAPGDLCAEVWVTGPARSTVPDEDYLLAKCTLSVSAFRGETVTVRKPDLFMEHALVMHGHGAFMMSRVSEEVEIAVYTRQLKEAYLVDSIAESAGGKLQVSERWMYCPRTLPLLAALETKIKALIRLLSAPNMSEQ